MDFKIVPSIDWSRGNLARERQLASPEAARLRQKRIVQNQCAAAGNHPATYTLEP
ncbi:hypothetical protein [Novosphingobium sp. KA1]|uniref:hypothetical protein n=1 Tax=Novosphingobium sp. (strain KA1) TaxID=164608 RepID=UPI001A8D922F|nr:hypothetical protein [Novosphingobium sp. KA1]